MVAMATVDEYVTALPNSCNRFLLNALDRSPSRPSGAAEVIGHAHDENGVAHSGTRKRKPSSPPPDQDDTGRSQKRSRIRGDLPYDEETRGNAHRERAPRSPPLSAARDHAPPRQRDSLQEEKKRGKRLFGGLLSTLSQTTANSHQRKRQEIERRQQEKAHLQRAHDDKLREKKLTKLRAVRRAEQIKFDEQVVCAGLIRPETC